MWGHNSLLKLWGVRRILPYRNHVGISIFARNFFGGMKLSRDKDSGSLTIFVSTGTVSGSFTIFVSTGTVSGSFTIFVSTRTVSGFVSTGTVSGSFTIFASSCFNSELAVQLNRTRAI